MEPAVKQRFIDFLERRLCDASLDPRHRFTKVGPHSFLFRDIRDTVFVKVSDENLIIILDGEEDQVVDHMEMIFLGLREDDEDAFEPYLQSILHKL